MFSISASQNSKTLKIPSEFWTQHGLPFQHNHELEIGPEMYVKKKASIV